MRFAVTTELTVSSAIETLSIILAGLDPAIPAPAADRQDPLGYLPAEIDITKVWAVICELISF
jgi:hypothetical protein